MSLAKTPGLRQARTAVRRLRPLGSSASYWERRYRAGGTSGAGSYGENARLKADIVNRVVRDRAAASVVEFGCGDGNQLSLLDLPRYFGLDVSATAVTTCGERFASDQSKSFFRYDPQRFFDRARVFAADLALSQEVIFHLVEDEVFERYMHHLFDAANRLVLICSTDIDERHTKHLRHRAFTGWVTTNQPQWRLLDQIPCGSAVGPDSLGDFYLYGRDASSP